MFEKKQLCSWLILIGILVCQVLLFDFHVTNYVAVGYPRWNDQIQYLSEVYRAHQVVLKQGLGEGLVYTLLEPAAQGLAHRGITLGMFDLFGASRLVALSLNLMLFLLLQIVFFRFFQIRFQSDMLAWISVGMLLCLQTLFRGPGSLIDYRLDFLACCFWGLALIAALTTDGFARTSRSLLFGICVGVTILSRFLTSNYFVVLYMGFAISMVIYAYYQVEGKKSFGLRFRNLLFSGSVAALIALPFFWQNRETIFNYYFIGHLFGPESAIRSQGFGLGESIAFIATMLVRTHFGIYFLFAMVFVLGIGTLVWLLEASKHWTTSLRDAGSRFAQWDLCCSLLFVIAPFTVLVGHTQNSDVVLSILVPGLVASIVIILKIFTVGILESNQGLPKCFVRSILLLGILCAAIGNQSKYLSAFDKQFLQDAVTVNQLADYIFDASKNSLDSPPSIAVDFVTDSIDARVMQVVTFERHHIWIDYSVTLPTGIVAEEENLLFKQIQQSDYVFLTERGAEQGPYPYDKQMRALFPKWVAYCDTNLQLVKRFELAGRTMLFYRRNVASP